MKSIRENCVELKVRYALLLVGKGVQTFIQNVSNIYEVQSEILEATHFQQTLRNTHNAIAQGLHYVPPEKKKNHCYIIFWNASR